MWDLIVSVPDHSLSFYFVCHFNMYITLYIFLQLINSLKI